MLKQLNTLMLRGFVAAQTQAGSAGQRIRSVEIDRTPRARVEMAGGALAAAMICLTSPAFADIQGSRANLSKLVETVGSLLVVAVAGLTVVMAAWGAAQFVVAGGSSSRASAAKKTLVHVAIGFVALAGVFIGRQVLLDVVGSVDNQGDGNSLRQQLGKGKLGGNGLR